MSRKPIEPGCTAMIVGGYCEENFGKIVSVGKFLGRFSEGNFFTKYADIWEVDKAIIFIDLRSGEKSLRYIASESNLQRLDDNDEDERTEQLIEEENHA